MKVIQKKALEFIKIKMILGCKWFVLFINDQTRLTWVYLMKDKLEAKIKFKSFIL